MAIGEQWKPAMANYWSVKFLMLDCLPLQHSMWTNRSLFMGALSLQSRACLH